MIPAYYHNVECSSAKRVEHGGLYSVELLDYEEHFSAGEIIPCSRRVWRRIDNGKIEFPSWYRQ